MEVTVALPTSIAHPTQSIPPLLVLFSGTATVVLARLPNAGPRATERELLVLRMRFGMRPIDLDERLQADQVLVDLPLGILADDL
jgi:hypothetical protein